MSASSLCFEVGAVANELLPAFPAVGCHCDSQEDIPRFGFVSSGSDHHFLNLKHVCCQCQNLLEEDFVITLLSWYKIKIHIYINTYIHTYICVKKMRTSNALLGFDSVPHVCNTYGPSRQLCVLVIMKG